MQFIFYELALPRKMLLWSVIKEMYLNKEIILKNTWSNATRAYYRPFTQ